MWSGIRNEISPTILAAATILVIFSILLLSTLEMLRRRSEKSAASHLTKLTYFSFNNNV